MAEHRVENEDRGQGRDRRGLKISTFLGLALIVGVLAVLLLPYFSWKAYGPVRKKRCTSNLSQIGKGFRLYRDANNDFLPDRSGLEFISALYETGILEDANVYLCPSSDDKENVSKTYLDASNCSYIGRDNIRHKLTSGLLAKYGSRTILAADKTVDHHGDVRCVLFADGHVEEVDEEEYLRVYSIVMGGP